MLTNEQQDQLRAKVQELIEALDESRIVQREKDIAIMDAMTMIAKCKTLDAAQGIALVVQLILST
jgi:hypothetical protein